MPSRSYPAIPMNCYSVPACTIILAALLTLAATAAAQVTVSPNTLNMGTENIGILRPDSFSIANTGGDSITVWSILVPEEHGFRLSGLELPFGIAAGDSATVRVVLLPRDTGCTRDSVRIFTSAINTGLIVAQCATAQPLQVPLDTLSILNFPATRVDSCSLLELPLPFPTRATLYGLYQEDGGDRMFRPTAQIPFEGLSLDEQALFFEFCPTGTGNYLSDFRCVTDLGVFVVRTTGRGVAKAQAVPRRYYLDTATGSVGETISLVLRVMPPLTSEDLIDSIGLILNYDRKGLVLDTAVHPEFPGNAPVLVTVEHPEGGSTGITIKRIGGFLSGINLLTLKFIGLSTGQPENAVEADGATSSAADTLFGDGRIYLEGCTLGASGFSRRVAVESLSIDPYSSLVVLRYTSPPGAEGRVSVIDASGSQALRLELPAGTGALQEFRLPLEGFFPGLYGLQIEVADDRLILPFISPR